MWLVHSWARHATRSDARAHVTCEMGAKKRASIAARRLKEQEELAHNEAKAQKALDTLTKNDAKLVANLQGNGRTVPGGLKQLGAKLSLAACIFMIRSIPKDDSSERLTMLLTISVSIAYFVVAKLMWW